MSHKMHMTILAEFILFALCALFAGTVLAADTMPDAGGGDIVQRWSEAAPPTSPQVEPMSVDAGKTALLILDIEELTCNMERRPRCLDTVPRIAKFAMRARRASMPVLYSLTPKRTPILGPVQPRNNEPIVAASVDKFLGTDLDRLLRERGVETVIITGTAAHGAVLHTATGAAQRGYGVILPVDGLSASSLYTEQAAVWCLKDGPGTRRKIALTRLEMINFR